ncbi:MAG: 50S ribosomal protein L11 methyltransferase [Desulfobacterales bacterium]|nr:50S ribosomal protein L11 methyltransferase [Desulfobacterales bacterium]
MTPSNEKRLLSILNASEIRVTPRDLAIKLALESCITNREARRVLKRLVTDGEIAYSYDFGATHVEPSFSRPVQITDHFVITPWSSRKDGDQTLEIVIAPGISFGSGRHPTTRLCLEAIDQTLLTTNGPAFPRRAADVGTGSGVLALALVRAGCDSCLALDTDLNCVSETQRNVALNRLQHRIEVTNELLDISHGPFDLVCANLRYPTLKQLSQLFYEITQPQALVILSGVRTWELNDLTDTYTHLGFTCTWTRNEKGWSAAVFKK